MGIVVDLHRQGTDSVTNYENRILDVLQLLAPAINWLIKVEPINATDVPPDHLEAVKRLETLGLVYRRNSRSYCVQKHRLIKMLKRESQYVSVEQCDKFRSIFALILESSGDLPTDCSIRVQQPSTAIS